MTTPIEWTAGHRALASDTFLSVQTTTGEGPSMRRIVIALAATSMLALGACATTTDTGTPETSASAASSTPASTSAPVEPTEAETTAAEPTEEPTVEEPVEETPAEPAEPELTVSQENAIESAQSYLELSGFSKKGLIAQLTSEYGEGFPRKDAVFAVEYLKPDWNAEAVEAAQSYLDTSSFSRQGLIEQLTSEYGEQFTLTQATQAVDSVGL